MGEFLVSIVAADLASTRVIVDTASNKDCGNDCPALSLADCYFWQWLDAVCSTVFGMGERHQC